MASKRKQTHADTAIASIAKDLRRIQRDAGTIPRELLNSLSNERLCWSYLTCHECQTPLVDSLRSLVKKARTSDRFVAAANILLAIHQVEHHERQVFDGDPRTGGELLTVDDLRAQLQHILNDTEERGNLGILVPAESGDTNDGQTVWDQAHRWAKQNFPRLEGKACTSEELAAACQEHIRLFPGVEKKRWLFVYSPGSMNDFFEVSDDPIRLMMACTKLGTVATEGGMLVGADFSENWGTPRSVGKLSPLLVCKPNGGNIG